MKTISEAYGQTVKWTGRWEYVLSSGGNVIGKVALKNDHGTLAEAECTEGRWTFKKKWFPSDRVILSREDSDGDLAVLKTKWGQEKGSLEFPDGHVFYWMPANVWRNKRIFTDVFGEHLLRFERNSNPLAALAMPKAKCTGWVQIERFAFYLTETPLLLLLGCYLMIIDAM